jgi:hypothetical protein
MPKYVTSKLNLPKSVKATTERPGMYWTDDGYPKLRTYLSNVLRGQPNVYTAPFAEGDEMDKVLSDWEAVLVSIKDEWPSLMDFENDLRNKVGPLSVQKPLSERVDDVAHYYEDILLSSKPIDPDAISRVIEEFRPVRGLRVRSQQNVVSKMKLSTNSGAPEFNSKRRNVIQDTVPIEEKSYPELQSTIWTLPSGRWMLDAVIGWRGQEGGPDDDDVKQRVVWMFPFAVNVRELQVYQPLIEACQQTLMVPAWVSMESVDQRVTALFDTKAKDDLVVCTDFSRFDQHFNKDMQDCAKTILEAILTPDSASASWLKHIFPIKYHIPLVLTATPKFFTATWGAHGMGSGSGGTNADETLTHRAMQHEVAMSEGEKLNPNSMCLGDDGILSYPGITVDSVVKAYESHGQECNKDKQYASTQDCVYLRRWHHTDYRVDGVCVGVYSTYRALGRLRYLERFMDPEYWSKEMVALRQLSIIENCKWHPLFHQFIDFCMKRDKYRLGLDIPGFMANIAKLATEATDHMQDFLGYTKTLQGVKPSGIVDWEVVKYLKSKA